MGKQMVNFANRLSASSEAKESANEFDSMLHGMGIVSPVTKSAAGSQYHSLLARQLVDFLIKQLKRCGGMMTLTDVYCFYNKARGTQLLSPDDLLEACRMMSSLGMPMKMKQFDKTGVMVLQLNAFNEQNQTKTILDLIATKCQNKGINELRMSQLLNISINLAREQLIFADYQSKVYWKDIKQINVDINNQKMRSRKKEL